jgi:hypothetical protein
MYYVERSHATPKRENLIENILFRVHASSLTNGQKRAIQAIVDNQFLEAIELCANMEATRRRPQF